MFNLKKSAFMGLCALGLFSACLVPAKSFANGDPERVSCYKNWACGISRDHKCHEKGLSFGINAILFNLSGDPISGVVEARIFNPSGKETFLGAIEFNSETSGPFIPLIFPIKHAKHSKEFGEYRAVIDIYCNESSLGLLSANLIGELLVLKKDFATSVNFIDLDIISSASNFQVTIPYYKHARREFWSSTSSFSPVP